mgnify:FL=1|jgi:hypothetical protein|tara:strand:- start:98 stop:304 length:207 start_codon:yes stop_codon:yes gene_type:complete
MKKFIEFALIWYSQQMAIPFWVVGHVHLSLNVYHDIYEIIISLGLNLIVLIGFILDYKKTKKNDNNNI